MEHSDYMDNASSLSIVTSLASKSVVQGDWLVSYTLERIAGIFVAIHKIIIQDLQGVGDQIGVNATGVRYHPNPLVKTYT